MDGLVTPDIELHSDADGAAPTVLTWLTGGPVGLPEGLDFLGADFTRAGPDLLIDAPGGATFIVPDYFMAEMPPALETASGQVLDGKMVDALAGPVAPMQTAQIGVDGQGVPTTDAGIAEGAPIGQVSDLEGTVSVTRADGTQVQLTTGDSIFQGDVLETGPKGSIGVVFVDDTVFTLDEGGRMVIDEMVYDPGTQTGVFNAQVVQGVFSFVSGKVAKTAPDSMTVSTPTNTIGVRGSTLLGRAGPEGSENRFTLMPDIDGTVGEIIIFNPAGSTVLNQPGASAVLFSFNAPPPPPVILPPQEIQQNFGATLTKLVRVVAVKAERDAERAREEADARTEEAQQAQEEAQQTEAQARQTEEEALQAEEEAAQLEAEAEAELAAAQAAGDEEAIAEAEAKLAAAAALRAEAEGKAAEAVRLQAEAEAKAAEAQQLAAAAEAAQQEAQQAQQFQQQVQQAVTQQQQMFETFVQQPSPDQLPADGASKADTVIQGTQTNDTNPVNEGPIDIGAYDIFGLGPDPLLDPLLDPLFDPFLDPFFDPYFDPYAIYDPFAFDLYLNQFDYFYDPYFDQNLTFYFGETIVAPPNGGTLSGTSLNTNYYFHWGSINSGAHYVITDAGGDNQLAFDNMNNVTAKVYFSTSTSGTINIYNTDFVTGGTYATISFKAINQFLLSDITVSGFDSVNYVDTAGGDVLVLSTLNAGQTGYAVAGSSADNTFNIDTTHYPGIKDAIFFGKGGGDTFNIDADVVQGDMTLIGGITSTDNKDTNSDGIPDIYVNVFDYSSTSLALNIRLSGYPNEPGGDAEVMDSFSNPTFFHEMWDVGSFKGGAGNDLFVIKGGKFNTVDGGTGNDTFIFNSSVKIGTLQGDSGGTGGADTYRYTTTTPGSITIDDFTTGVDKFEFSRAAFNGDANSDGTPDTALESNATSGVTSSSGASYFVYNSADKILYYDADASGSGTGVQIADLNTGSVAPGDIAFVA